LRQQHRRLALHLDAVLQMRSASSVLTPASGSRLSGAPALAASRCQAMASAMFSRGCASSDLAFSAHSAAMASWPLARLISSSFSRSRRAAPLSRALSSRKTSCICSALGSPASQSRRRAARSPEVGAVKAPPVRASSAWVSWVFKVLTAGIRWNERKAPDRGQGPYSRRDLQALGRGRAESLRAHAK
jgi:hypothetical protein